ncbi:hypothetical protein JAAARDRAFT_610572 [Jaapia argillacea MUCL 33604]|uniref:MARVEL domain-containing protein n=1 Tax=Jaapia argillacea MUCL 33604 TaxID=933084 RepID=A0A067P4Y4_9AGAM|nr:hypothetical protein JAAARDRAFT_610572 [Jaapia argillacea MUCL 33604]
MAFHHTRIVLYVILWLFSLVLLGLTADRLYYTTHLKRNDPLHDGINFYDPIIVELMVTSALMLFWIPYIVHVIHGVHEKRVLYRFRGEIIGLFVLWVMWLVGAAYATSLWPDLSWCHQYRPCRILTTLVAFAWMGWIILTIILLATVLFAWSNRAFNEPLHGRWNPRASVFRSRA